MIVKIIVLVKSSFAVTRGHVAGVSAITIQALGPISPATCPSADIVSLGESVFPSIVPTTVVLTSAPLSTLGLGASIVAGSASASDVPESAASISVLPLHPSAQRHTSPAMKTPFEML